MNFAYCDFVSRKEYADLRPEQQQYIRDRTLQFAYLVLFKSQKEFDKFIEVEVKSDLEIEAKRTAASSSSSSNINTATLSTMSFPSSDSENTTTSNLNNLNKSNAMDFFKDMYANRENIKKESMTRLGTLEEIISDFNESYQESKTEAMNKVLDEGDYLDNIKKSLLMHVGIEEESTKTNDIKATEMIDETEKKTSNKIEEIK